VSAEHWCLAYAEEGSLQTATDDFLSAGVALGQQVGYFGWGGSDALRGQLRGLAGGDELVRRGAARITSLDEHFRRDEPPDPLTLVEFWAKATDAALDAGFTALRAVADTTPWAALNPAQRTVFLRGEQLVDRYRLDHPFALICACDASTLAGDALAETACIHPFAEGVSTPFHLHATEDADFALHGEIDAFALPLLQRALSSLPDVDGQSELVLNADGLAFIDHCSLIALNQHAERSGVEAVVLRKASRTSAKLVTLLDLRRIRVEEPR
jgi:hypothetical protein